MNNSPKQKIALLISSRGRSSYPMIASIETNPFYSIDLIITHHSDAPIVEKAKQFGIACVCINRKGKTKQQIDQELADTLKQYAIDMVLLVGYMRILSADFVSQWPCINIHPSLLPKYKGLMDLEVHRQVINNKDSDMGVSLHWVSPAVDDGPLLKQYAIKTPNTMDIDIIKERIQQLESDVLIDIIQHPDLKQQWKQLSFTNLVE